MMNPSVYRREAERIENKAALRCHSEKPRRPAVLRDRDYSREYLACGCILYRMLVSSKFVVAKELA